MKLNRVEIIGRVVRDAETKMTQSVKVRQYFSIAINDDYKKQGTEEWVKRVYFYSCYTLKEYEGLFKGVRVLIVGKLITVTYEDKKTGDKKTIPYIEVASLDFMAGGSNKIATEVQPEQQIEKQAEQEQKQEYPIKEEDYSEEVPF